MSVGFVGLGNIGAPMARRLAPSVGVYDVSADALAGLTKLGATAFANLVSLARDVDVLCVMVRDDDQVRAVLDEALPALRPGSVVVVHSTVAPETPALLEETLSKQGVLLVDAPVSGGAMGAAEGSLAILVGGSTEAFEAARPTLDLMGSMVVHCGPIGAGTKAKLARNLIHFVAFTAAAEASRLAEAAGLDLVELGRIVRHTDAITGGPGAIMHRDTAAPVHHDDGWRAILDHVRSLGEKDLGFAIGLADELGVDVPLARLALENLGSGLGVA